MGMLYRYEGSLSMHQLFPGKNGGCVHADIVLEDMDDEDKFPIRLTAYGALAQYLSDLSWTDAEEKYLKKTWYFDGTLSIRRVEVPDKDEAGLAKVITTDGLLSDELIVFGYQELIDTTKPEQMNTEEASRMADYIYQHQDWWYKR